ncbi:MAG: hypothetical protein ACLU9S_03615 [Oscillospiraceae bacterium]
MADGKYRPRGVRPDHGKEGCGPPTVFETNNLLVLCRMVGQGMGVALIPCKLHAEKQGGHGVFFHLSPVLHASGHAAAPGRTELSEAERYLAYLVIRSDMENPAYRRSLGTCGPSRF